MNQVLEPRFTAESMATLLSIPVGKKLLRRHLATHFESLVGPACTNVKETALASGLTPILPGEKHKVKVKSYGQYLDNSNDNLFYTFYVNIYWLN